VGEGDRGAGGGGGSGGPTSKPRKRVTLKFDGPALALPGELDERLPPEPPSLELSLDLPELAEAVRPDLALPVDPASDLDDVEGPDGWARLRRTQRPPRARSLTPSADDALGLVERRSRPPPPPPVTDLGRDMADRFELGDFSGALRVAELALGQSPDDPAAQRIAQSSREKLVQLHGARLGALAGVVPEKLGRCVPTVIVPEHEVRWLGLDHRQGFVLSRLDGRASIDDLLDVTGMSRLEIYRTLVELLEAKAISL
jgi:hypothetical protein